MRYGPVFAITIAIAFAAVLALAACGQGKTPTAGETAFDGHCREVAERMGKRVGGFAEFIEARQWRTDAVQYVSVFFLDASAQKDRHWVKCEYPLDLPAGEHVNAESIEFDGVTLTHADKMLVNSAVTGWRNR